MNKTSSIIIGFISIVLTSVYAGDPPFTDYKTWVENEDCILLLHSEDYCSVNYTYYTGTLRLIHKRDQIVLLEKEVGYLTYIWLSPDSKFIVGFSSCDWFNLSSGYNLIILNSTGEILHKKSIGSGYVKNTKASDIEDSMFRRIYFYDYRNDPNIKLEYGKLGNVIAISFNDAASVRARIPLGKSISDQNEFKKRTLEDGQESLNEMIQNQRLDPIVTTPGDSVEAQCTQGHP